MHLGCHAGTKTPYVGAPVPQQSTASEPPPPPPGDATSALPDSWAAYWRERAEAARFAADRGAA